MMYTRQQLKQARKAGCRIQMKTNSGDKWLDGGWLVDADPSLYRIHPEDLHMVTGKFGIEAVAPVSAPAPALGLDSTETTQCKYAVWHRTSRRFLLNNLGGFLFGDPKAAGYRLRAMVPAATLDEYEVIAVQLIPLHLLEVRKDDERAGNAAKAAMVARGYVWQGGKWIHARTEPQPDGYHYLYPDGVIRKNNGREVNARSPVQAVPYWYDRPTPPWVQGREVYTHCQNGRPDVCRAAQRDDIICPEESCDIDDGVRPTDEELQRATALKKQHPDDVAVDKFTDAMKLKLLDARTKGRGGWEDKDFVSREFLSQLLREHVDKGGPLDVANFCCFLWNRAEGIASASTPSNRGEIVIKIARKMQQADHHRYAFDYYCKLAGAAFSENSK